MNPAGAYINRLIKGLREGGKHQKGQEMIAHDESNIAIVVFGEFLHALEESKRKTLLKASKIDRWVSSVATSLSIESCWNRLARPLDSNGDNTTYCVEMIANNLAEILAENPSLYQLVPFEETTQTRLSHFDLCVKDSKASLLTDIMQVDSSSYYGASADQALALSLCSLLCRDTGYHLTVNEIIYIATLYTTHYRLDEAFSQNLSSQCAQILTNVGHDYGLTRFRIMNQACKGMTPEVLAEVDGFLRPTSASREQAKNMTFFQEKSSQKQRKREYTFEPDHKRCRSEI